MFMRILVILFLMLPMSCGPSINEQTAPSVRKGLLTPEGYAVPDEGFFEIPEGCRDPNGFSQCVYDNVPGYLRRAASYQSSRDEIVSAIEWCEIGYCQ